MVDYIDSFWDENFAEPSPLDSADKVESAVRHGEFAAVTRQDTDDNGRKWKVCLDCVSGFMKDAGIPMPNTSSVPVFMDAMHGRKVKLWEHDEFTMGRVEGDRKIWSDYKNFQTITDPNDLRPGDVMIVESHSGNYSGLHTTLVTNINGTDKGWSMFTGVDVVHDMGANYPVQKSQYEWHELHYGSKDSEKEGNRKFVEAYRYIGD